MEAVENLAAKTVFSKCVLINSFLFFLQEQQLLYWYPKVTFQIPVAKHKDAIIRFCLS